MVHKEARRGIPDLFLHRYYDVTCAICCILKPIKQRFKVDCSLIGHNCVDVLNFLSEKEQGATEQGMM